MEIAAVIFVVIAIMVIASRFEHRENIVPRDEFPLNNDTTSPLMSDRFMISNINHDNDD